MASISNRIQNLKVCLNVNLKLDIYLIWGFKSDKMLKFSAVGLTKQGLVNSMSPLAVLHPRSFNASAGKVLDSNCMKETVEFCRSAEIFDCFLVPVF